MYCNWFFDSAACCCSLIALRERGRVRIGGLLELRLRDQVLFRLRLVAIELLLREHEAVLRGVELRLRTGGIFLCVGGVELGDDLTGFHDVAETHAPFDDLAADAKRQRRRITRLYFAGQGRGLHCIAVRMHGERDDGARLGRRCFFLRACAQAREHRP